MDAFKVGFITEHDNVDEAVEELQLDLCQMLEKAEVVLRDAKQKQSSQADLDETMLMKEDIIRLQAKVKVLADGIEEKDKEDALSDEDSENQRVQILASEKVAFNAIKTTLEKRVKVCARKDRLLEKRASTPKRLKTEPPSPGTFALDSMLGSASQPFQPDANAPVSLSNDGCLTFAQVVAAMDQDASVIVRVPKLPLAPKFGDNVKGTSYVLLKIEVFQPQSRLAMHLVGWKNLAESWLIQLRPHEEKVVKMEHLKYEYNAKYSEHQLVIQPSSVLTEVRDSVTTDAFNTYQTKEVTLESLPRKAQFERVNFQGFLKSCDPEPQGPSQKGHFWRNCEIANVHGTVVRGQGWGPIVEQDWLRGVSCEFHGVSVRPTQERVQFDESTVLVFKPSYDLSASKPVFFKPLRWNA